MRLGVKDTHFLLWYFSLQHLKGKPHKNLEEENKLLVYRKYSRHFYETYVQDLD